ncbi:hypothetical protein [Pedobacter cryoconitis]|uniref:hypothetical protein n=1 Tax=Pedobacter cryoconitis TaxID=188932 RepID=UPI0016102B56|nr:hypothetical protein [Pedobacter cryoconitis]MBB5647492.1 hypothetical protein [Pedobacter cryoconitis]
MKRFIKRVIFFIFPIVLLGFSSDILLKSIPNDYAYKKRYLDKNAKNIEVLLLGNSHVYYGIDPTYIKKPAFNAAHISQSLNYDLEILKKYNSSLINLKKIVIPIDYFSLYTTLETGVEKWRTKNYSLYYDINPSNDWLNNSEILNMKLGVNVSRMKNYLLTTHTEVTCNQVGWGTNYNSKNGSNLEETGKLAVARHTVSLKDNRCFNSNIETINSIIALAKARRVEIVFVTCPAYKSYTELLNKEQLNNTINSITKIVAKHPGTKYFNLLNDTTFKEADFFDADHLNEHGAKKLSLKIDSLMN